MLLHMIGSQRIAKCTVNLAVWLATRGGAANSAVRRSHGRLSKMQLIMLRTHLHFNDDSRGGVGATPLVCLPDCLVSTRIHLCRASPVKPSCEGTLTGTQE